MQPYFREVTLSALLASIAARWKLIVTITVAALVAGAIYALAWPATYDAAAIMAEMTSNSTVQLDQGLKTEPDSASSLRERNADAQAHQQLMITLIGSRAVATRVARKLGDQLGGDEIDPLELRRRVEVSSNAGTGLYQIEVTDREPKQAARIANTWAAAAQEYVSQQMTLETSTRLGALSAPTRNMLQRYKAAQHALEAFLAQSPQVRLTREITRQRDLAQRFRAAQWLLGEAQAIEAHAAGADTGPRAADGEPLAIPLLLLEVQAFDGQLPTTPWPITPVTVASSQTSTASAAGAPSPTAAASNSAPPVQLQISDAARAAGADMQARVHRLVTLLKARLQRVSEQADAMWQKLGLTDASNAANTASPTDAGGKASSKSAGETIHDDISEFDRTGDRIDAALTRLQWLQEKSDATLRELSQLRDAAWGSYVSMQRIQAAANVPGGVETTRLWTVSGAVPPEYPSQSLVAVLIWSGLIGLGLSVAIAFMLESSRPLITTVV